MTDSMVERVARAICRSDALGPTCVMDEHPERPPCTDENCRRFEAARAAIEAMREPSDAMCAAGVSRSQRGGFEPKDTWRLMITAALAEEAEGGEG